MNALRNAYDPLTITMDDLDQILALALFVLRNRTGSASLLFSLFDSRPYSYLTGQIHAIEQVVSPYTY